jgi:hypothetical protein
METVAIIQTGHNIHIKQFIRAGFIIIPCKLTGIPHHPEALKMYPFYQIRAFYIEAGYYSYQFHILQLGFSAFIIRKLRGIKAHHQRKPAIRTGEIP